MDARKIARKKRLVARLEVSLEKLEDESLHFDEMSVLLLGMPPETMMEITNDVDPVRNMRSRVRARLAEAQKGLH